MKSKITSIITCEIDITLSEIEARALSAIAGYGTETFLQAFYEKLGSHYLKPHEVGLISLFKSIGPLDHQLKRIDKARKAFHED